MTKAFVEGDPCPECGVTVTAVSGPEGQDTSGGSVRPGTVREELVWTFDPCRHQRRVDLRDLR